MRGESERCGVARVLVTSRFTCSTYWPLLEGTRPPIHCRIRQSMSLSSIGAMRFCCAECRVLHPQPVDVGDWLAKQFLGISRWAPSYKSWTSELTSIQVLGTSFLAALRLGSNFPWASRQSKGYITDVAAQKLNLAGCTSSK